MAKDKQDDDFIVVTNRKNKGKKADNTHPRRVEGLKLNKPKTTFIYRQKKKPGTSTSDNAISHGHNRGSQHQALKNADNFFDANEETSKATKSKDPPDDSDNEVEEAHIDSVNNATVGKGASTNQRVQALPLQVFLMFSLATWNIRGLNCAPKLSEVRQVVFRTWDWTSNANLCSKGCHIIVGWKLKVVDVLVVNITSQVMHVDGHNMYQIATKQKSLKKTFRKLLYEQRNLHDRVNRLQHELDEVVDVLVVNITSQVMHVKITHKETKREIFCSFVYAVNLPIERRKLWSDLDIHKNLVRGKDWVLLGDFNVALNLEDNFSSSSQLTSHMLEFKDCVENIE
nr:hypothetical protein [Tanacetum cinerariifolium]